MNLAVFEKLARRDKPITIGIAGAGEFSVELVTQVSYIHKMEVSAVADVNAAAAVAAFKEAGYHDTDIVIAESKQSAVAAVEQGKRVVLEDARILCELPVDAVCDITGDPVFGAEFAYRAIENGKHVIVVNIESDVVVGPILRRLADKAGVVYTEADGDQPSLIKGLYDWAKLLGLEVFGAGKWTRVRPEEMYSLAGKRTDIGYSDGSKNQVEMCCVANMTGLVPDVRGMHMPSLTLKQIPDTFDLADRGGIFSKGGVIDVVNCLGPDGKTVVEPLLGGGVFIIVRCDSRVARDVIKSKGFLYNKACDHALIYRPYHFVGIETPVSIARAVMYKEPTGSPLPSPVADVIAVAKKDLHPGELLDGIGGKTVRGLVDRADIVRQQRLLPLGLAEGVKPKVFIPRGTAITYDMLESEGDSFIWRLRRLQDEVCK
jgi:predicted homoserine dehydrogenase-like protein